MQTVRPPSGFSLLELMFVSLLLAVLTGAGILTWSSLQERTQDGSAEVNLQTVAAAQLSHRQSRGTWATSAAQLQSISGGVSIISGISTGPDQISIFEDASGRLILAARSESGICLAVRVGLGEAGGGQVIRAELPLNCSGSSVASIGILP